MNTYEDDQDTIQAKSVAFGTVLESLRVAGFDTSDFSYSASAELFASICLSGVDATTRRIATDVYDRYVNVVKTTEESIANAGLTAELLGTFQGTIVNLTQKILILEADIRRHAEYKDRTEAAVRLVGLLQKLGNSKDFKSASSTLVASNLADADTAKTLLGLVRAMHQLKDSA